MPKLKLKPVDHSPPAPLSAMFVKVLGLSVMIISLFGIAWMLLAFSEETPSNNWEWSPKDVKTNFKKVITSEQRDALLNRIKSSTPIDIETNDPGKPDTSTNSGTINAPEDPVAPENPEDLPVPPNEYDDDPKKNTGTKDVLNRKHNLKLAKALKDDAAFNIVDEAETVIDLVLATIDDSDQTKLLSEHNANKSRQQPAMERLALQVLKRIGGEDLSNKEQTAGYMFGKHVDVVDHYRGKVFPIDGRLFDLYVHKLPKPIILADGSSIDKYYEGVVCYLNAGDGRDDPTVAMRTVIFQSLTLPDELKSYLNANDSISHEDKLATENVRVAFSGAYLRRWVYHREVKPFSLKSKRVHSQAVCPLLLASELKFEGIHRVPLTDELLQQVRDSLAEDPQFLEAEGAYYAMLAKANSKDDKIEVVPEISFFDLAGMETGPKYRSQGIHIQGMIGDDYHPVIFPPNISGLRRIFRAYLLADMYNLQSKKRFLIDMIEAPSGLEPQALVEIDARYYRNVYEAQKTTTEIRPLLIVKQMTKYSTGADEDNWYYGLFGVVGIFLLLGSISYLVFSDRKERASFERSAMEISHERIRKRGDLKLKPLVTKSGEGGPVAEKSADVSSESETSAKDSVDDSTGDKPDATGD
ncbi:hypothetical protein OAU50_03540 [Planctomycetota bacterium]|nr:hypothetical protein [Planctomycetota bacterium]